MLLPLRQRALYLPINITSAMSAASKQNNGYRRVLQIFFTNLAHYIVGIRAVDKVVVVICPIAD